MCFVLSWYNELWAICKAAILSHNNLIDSLKIPTIQTTSCGVFAIARYSAYAEDLETVVSFFVFHYIKEFSSLIQYPVTDLLVMGQVPQTESQYDVKRRSLCDASIIPGPVVAFKYLSTLTVASICDLLGSCMNWLNVWTTKQMSGFVTVRYIRRPISLR